MTTLHRWDRKRYEYEDFEVPDSWHVSTYERDMATEVRCPHCGRRLPFGECYTSLEVHALPSGFGYAVCEACYQGECARERAALEGAHVRNVGTPRASGRPRC